MGGPQHRWGWKGAQHLAGGDFCPSSELWLTPSPYFGRRGEDGSGFSVGVWWEKDAVSMEVLGWDVVLRSHPLLVLHDLGSLCGPFPSSLGHTLHKPSCPSCDWSS